MPKPKSSLQSDADQSARFIEAAHAAGASEDETVFDANLKQFVKAKPKESDSFLVNQQRVDPTETKPCP